MAKAIAKQLIWDLKLDSVVEKDQKWVLCAMSSYGQSLVNMLWRILGDEQDVMDAYQDTFVKLSNTWQDGKPGNVKAYLFRTASSVAISILRNKVRQEKVFRNFAFQQEAAKQYHDNANDFDMEKLRKQLRTYIAKLPEHLQQIIVLRDLAELPYKQIAKITGIRSASARVYRRRAIVQLSEWMANEGFDDE